MTAHANIFSMLILLCALGSATAQARFQTSPQGDEVTDRKTGLVWKRCAEGMEPKSRTSCSGQALFFTHPAALQRAAEQVKSGGTGWRLATMKELSAIAAAGEADPSENRPAIDPTAFPNTPPARFWSSTIVGPHYFMYVNFADATVGEGLRNTPAAVRLVRSAQ